MAAKSKFEEGLDLLERAIPLLREAYTEQADAVRHGIINMLEGMGQQTSRAPQPSVSPQVSPFARVVKDKAKVSDNERDAAGRAPRGAAEQAARAVLLEKGSATWSDFIQGAAEAGVSASAIKKAVGRLKEAKEVKQEGYKFSFK